MIEFTFEAEINFANRNIDVEPAIEFKGSRYIVSHRRCRLPNQQLSLKLTQKMETISSNPMRSSKKYIEPEINGTG